ncbi:hypothetical protein LY76DRAFT_599625 [Colletotrichum caudatum]|nr:hypothetical protein LY76DRAFT_599625 [Colletotrichum caudatum]
MARHFTLFTTIISFLSLGLVRAAVVRVDDYVVLNGTALVFDPMGGFNDTTRDLAWQDGYFQSLNLLAINDLYREANAGISQRDLKPRDGATMLACMVVKLASGLATTRTQAFVLCEADNPNTSGVSLRTMKDKIKYYWAIAGIGAYAVGNYAYDVWVDYNW